MMKNRDLGRAITSHRYSRKKKRAAVNGPLPNLPWVFAPPLLSYTIFSPLGGGEGKGREGSDGGMASVYIPVQGTEEEVRVALDHLPADASDILDILKAEQAPLHLWLIIAVNLLTSRRNPVLCAPPRCPRDSARF